MALQLKDANNKTQTLPIWIDPIYRAAGQITDVQAGGSACDILLFTAAATGVTRLLKAKFRLTGGGTASAAGGNLFEMLRVTGAPTGQINVPVVLTQHSTTDAAPGSTVNITPSGSQTAGTGPTVLAASNLSLSLAGISGDLFQSIDCEFPAGPDAEQKAIIVPPSGFITFRPAVAVPANCVIAFDLMFSEASV